MKGKIIGRDREAYLVSGDDGKRYQFLREDWLGKKAPNIDDAIDFVCEGDSIKSVIPIFHRKILEQSRLALAILSFFFGAFGIHRFMANKLGTALAMFLITIMSLGLGGLITVPWALIDFIFILTGNFGKKSTN
ncbi:TM2 domain-containing protein [Bartonella sp. AA56HLJMS]|uniref:TM2 domain-containing protein n=1 Tax=Bartonella sp. AA56HLJMS TaxID=3243434 RepID=UPI0035CF30C6